MTTSPPSTLACPVQTYQAPGTLLTGNFDLLARPYRWMEYLTFGPLLARCRLTFLADLTHCRQAMVLGDGDGRFTARLLRSNPFIRIDAVDASPAMLRTLVRRAGPLASRVRAHHADARAWQPASPPCDLIATHFFLDCLTTTEIRALAQRLRSHAAPSALWLVSEFAVPPTLFGRLIARPIVASLYCAFGLLTGLGIRTLPDHSAAFLEAGFVLLKSHTRLRGLLVSELWSAGQSAPSATL